MQKATTILSIIQQRGIERKPLQRVYRLLYHRELYKIAYAKIYRNRGATTPGSDAKTLDGMSAERISHIIDLIKGERYRWQPVRRTYIRKKSGKLRPLGIPSGDDKLLQEVIRLILEAYYEPQFSCRSHGFRPKRGCHTALAEIARTHKGTKWFIEGDIQGCFDNIQHDKLLAILAKQIEDKRFLNLIKRLLQAGYLEEWKWHNSYSGTPQGGIVSPVLTNIYLHELDRWIEETLLPQYNRGTEQDSRDPDYMRHARRKSVLHQQGHHDAAIVELKRMQAMPSRRDTPRYRRLRYIRYADDFLLSFIGPRCEAEEIKAHIGRFLREELGLELSADKTLITHAGTTAAHFLGHSLKIMHSDTKKTVYQRLGRRVIARSATGQVWLGIPAEKLKTLRRRYSKQGKPVHRPELLMNSDYHILTLYQSEWRGYVQYYIMAHNLSKLRIVWWTMSTSLLKTLAAKHKITVRQAYRRYRTILPTAQGPRRGYQVVISRKDKPPLVAQFGGIPLVRNAQPQQMEDNLQRQLAHTWTGHSELLQRMQRNQCELCGQREGVEVHHIRGLADLNRPGRKPKPLWMHKMAVIRRKTLVVCQTCHQAIHQGRHRNEWEHWKCELESRVN
jgi:group II intron reverse transcriptase/maturase